MEIAGRSWGIFGTETSKAPHCPSPAEISSPHKSRSLVAAGGSQIPSPGRPWKWQGRSRAGPGPDVNIPVLGQEADAGLTLRGAGSCVIASQEVPAASGK